MKRVIQFDEHELTQHENRLKRATEEQLIRNLNSLSFDSNMLNFEPFYQWKKFKPLTCLGYYKDDYNNRCAYLKPVSKGTLLVYHIQTLDGFDNLIQYDKEYGGGFNEITKICTQAVIDQAYDRGFLVPDHFTEHKGSKIDLMRPLSLEEIEYFDVWNHFKKLEQEFVYLAKSFGIASHFKNSKNFRYLFEKY